MSDVDRELERTPGGYRLAYPEIGVTIEANQVRWSGGSLYGIVAVRARIAGVRAVSGGVVSESRVNLSSDRGRLDVAKACAARAPDVDLDWRGLLEEFSVRVMAAEREGQPFIAVGDLPKRVDPGHVVAPVLPVGRVSIFYGPGGTTKGYLMTGVAVSVTTGVTIIPGYVPRLGEVLYLDWESDRWDLDDRVKRIARGASIPHPVELRYRECTAPLTDQIDEIEREVRRYGVTLVVIDSVGMALSTSREGGDANESTIRLFQALRRIPCAVAAVDHVVGAEVGRKRSSRPYGSVYKTNLARNTYEIRALDNPADDGSVRHIVVRHTKSNMGPPQPDQGFAVRFDNDTGAVTWQAEEIREAQDPEDEQAGAFAPATRDLLRELLERGHHTEDELADETGRQVLSVRRVLNRYSERATKPENRWFNRLPSGAWEALPLAPREATDAG